MAKLTSEEIPEKKLKELFDAAGGRRSHYLFIRDEPQEFIDELTREDWIVPLKNGANAPMFTISQKLVEKYRVLDEHEKAQLKAQKVAEEEQVKLDNEEIKAALEKKKEVVPTKGIASKPVEVDGHVYASVAACSRAEGISTSEVRSRIKSEDYYEWNYYEENN